MDASEIGKVKPPFDEIGIEVGYNKGGKGYAKPYLIASVECLEAILHRENSVIAEEDVPRLLAALCHHAIRADCSDQVLAVRLAGEYEAEIDQDAG